VAASGPVSVWLRNGEEPIAYAPRGACEAASTESSLGAQKAP